MKSYKKTNIPLAKELRKNMTPWERKLWYEYLRFYPVRFQRQKALGNYIADFYCAKARLIIELDGGGHYKPLQLQADATRTAALSEIGLRVLRICNLDVDNNFRGVCEYIDQIVQNSLPQSASLTAPSSEGALNRPQQHKRVYALGFFDGVHLGHQALLAECRRLATLHRCKAAAITFDLPPGAVLQNQAPNMLTNALDRQRLLRHFGMDEVTVFPATPDSLSMPWQKFLNRLVDAGAVGFVCGQDYRFGHKGEGDAEKLAAFAAEKGFPCSIVPEQQMDGEKISSTRIRRLLEQGDVENANRLLGHPHILTGTVISGQKIGRTIGIPTANLPLPPELLTPALGVYACIARVDGKEYPAVTNIGTRPTVGGVGITAEAWLQNFSGDLYGKMLTLEFHSFLRPEKTFPSLEALKEEILKNRRETLNFFEKCESFPLHLGKLVI